VLKSIVAISVGASLGALLRWWLGLALNGVFPTIPPGTLVANLVGGYLVGLVDHDGLLQLASLMLLLALCALLAHARLAHAGAWKA
jgi:fluoride ion exporter CrcB/FEX